MESKLDFKKEYRDIYLPGREPMLLTLPPILYLMVDGRGAPEGASYQEAVELLYGVAYTIKMSKMGGGSPDGYQDFVVPPLEGLWDCGVEGFSPDRESWTWTSLLRMPEFVTQEVFGWARDQTLKKKPHLKGERVRLEWYDEGLCAQIMHLGPYTSEQESLDRLRAFLEERQLTDDCGGLRRHHEVYLSDPRRTAPEKLKTILRHPVR